MPCNIYIYIYIYIEINQERLGDGVCRPNLGLSKRKINVAAAPRRQTRSQAGNSSLTSPYLITFTQYHEATVYVFLVLKPDSFWVLVFLF